MAFCTSVVSIVLLGIKAKEAATVLNLRVRAMKGYRCPETLIPFSLWGGQDPRAKCV